MSRYIETIDKANLPVIGLRKIVAFPGVTISVELSDVTSIKAAEAAFETDSLILLCTLTEQKGDKTECGNLYNVGTVAKIKQSVKSPEGNLRIIAEGYSRASIIEFRTFADYITADVISKTLTFAEDDDIRSQAYNRAMLSEIEGLVKFLPSVSDDIMFAAKSIKNSALLADFIASNILVKFEDKQEILECFEPVKRIETLISLIREETTVLQYELEIHKKVRENLSRNQKEYYLREQIHVIQEELGEGPVSEIDEYNNKIISAKLPHEVEEKLLKENDRMSKTPFGSAEASVLRSYLDVCLDLPWNRETKERTDIATARKILDDDHDGLDKVKERILEYLAVKQLNPNLGNQILCLVGPPGVGKTSVASSIARATKRKFVRVSLGGIRDEADIRGHRKTYIGAMPGRIMAAVSQAKSKNPLILLDEIDKISRDAHGDPSSALLEVLDSEQNHAFRDHFIELPFDLSDCMFIATANTLETVPRPLLDRMEIIEMKAYTKPEKLGIAKDHLISKQLKRHGLSRRTLRITDGALTEIIDYYTREAGVRNLERTIADIARKAAKKLVENPSVKHINIDTDNVADYLGKRKLMPELISDEDEVGIVNGLAWTEAGGDLLKVEVAVLDGTGKIELTGSLGDVMKESAHIAVSYVRSIATEYSVPSDFYKNRDIHIHFPEGAVPKDGPSAGVTMATALVSALTGRRVRRDIAMTGEITLRGKVLAIGGLREKSMAAYTAGIRTVLIPQDNMRDLDDIDAVVRDNVKFVPCRTAADILGAALLPKEAVIKEPDLRLSNAAEFAEMIPSVISGTTQQIPVAR